MADDLGHEDCSVCEEAKTPRGAITNCKDCKHWGSVSAEPYTYYDAEGEEMRSDGHRKCGKITLLEVMGTSRGEIQRALVFTQDASDCKADLWTASEFGCVLGEEG